MQVVGTMHTRNKEARAFPEKFVCQNFTENMRGCGLGRESKSTREKNKPLSLVQKKTPHHFVNGKAPLDYVFSSIYQHTFPSLYREH